jgi:hypothetical protein
MQPLFCLSSFLIGVRLPSQRPGSVPHALEINATVPKQPAAANEGALCATMATTPWHSCTSHA